MQCPDCSAPGADITLSGPAVVTGNRVKLSAVAAYRLTCGQCGWTVVGEIHDGHLVPIGTRKEGDSNG